jgi:peptidyl-Lys metalloendopeptidase
MKFSLRAIVGALLLAGVGSAYAANPLSVELRAQTNKASPGESVVWSLTNNSDETVHVLRWETPLDGLSRSIFEVSKNGRPVRYMDKLVHWGHPDADDFVKVGPGETISAEVNLAASYEMVDAGSYTVSFEGQLSYVMATDEKSGHIEDLGASQLDADPIELYSMGRSPGYYQSLGALPATVNRTKAGTYANCSSSQQTSFGSTHNNAKTYSANAAAYLNAGTRGTRYTTWFGSYTSSRYNTVKSHFNLINNALISSTITYDCYCTPSAASAYAYVYPSQPYIIHLCNAFWSAPATGTDSKAGTIIHEMSHFTVNGGTKDNAYGQTAAKSLASRTPSKAVANADNHEYFAENTPALN